MNGTHAQARVSGFSLIELMVSLTVFIVVCGAIFGLMGASQKNYQADSQILHAFQEARLGMDQITRDATNSGFPPRNQFSAINLANATQYAATPVAWSPNTSIPCQIGSGGAGTCVSPSDFDVIFEENFDGSGVSWIRYHLQETTLLRGVVPKSPGTDPITATTGAMFPYVRNVMNNASAAQIAAIQATYPAMFPGGAPQPIFQYMCDSGAGTVACSTAGASNSPANISDIIVNLIVQAPQRDSRSGVPRLVTLGGRIHRVNPNQ